MTKGCTMNYGSNVLHCNIILYIFSIGGLNPFYDVSLTLVTIVFFATTIKNNKCT